MVSGLRLSLRRYVIWSLFSLATLVVTLFSIESSDSFLDSMDGMLRNMMVRAAETAQLDESGQAQILDLRIVANYNDLPSDVKAIFPESQLTPNTLLKDVTIPVWYQRPTSARFAILITLPDGEPRFVSQVFSAPPKNEAGGTKVNHVVYNIVIGVVALISLGVALLFLMRSVSRPVESLQRWAADLDEAKLDAPISTFRYKELDALAHIIHTSLKDVRDTLNREREFVNHASHELRTPIAVVRSSLALMHRVTTPCNSKATNAVQRIDHASKTMADLTETLLWLGRDNQDSLPIEQVNVEAMVSTLAQDLKYLLKGKDVSVTLALEACELFLPKTASEIVIGNIIRNAYQHTQCGSVAISLRDNQLEVVNEEQKEEDQKENEQDASKALATANLPGNATGAERNVNVNNSEESASGFGIGLKLLDKLTGKLNWAYQQRTTSNGVLVTLVLETH